MPTTARSFLASAALHLVALAAAIALVGHGAAPPALTQVTARLAKPAELPRLVFIATPGPGGGGGGGGNRRAEPIQRAQAPGRDAMTLRVQRPIVAAERPAPVPETIAPVVLDAKPLASGAIEQAGLPAGGVPSSGSLGPGSGGGVGEGTGTGIGPGRGPGVGPGIGGGTGGGVYRVGSGVSPPQILTQIRPSYTSEALSRKIQGTVELELIVTRAGLPSQIRILRSLDSGLDAEAVKAVAQWRFVPGRVGQQPVDVWVTIFLDFTIR